MATEAERIGAAMDTAARVVWGQLLPHLRAGLLEASLAAEEQGYPETAAALRFVSMYDERLGEVRAEFTAALARTLWRNY